jgi:hypothetical protein
MTRDSAWITVVERPAIEGVCDLCATSPTHLDSVVTVRHTHGGAVQFAACSNCTRAMRRIATVVGSDPAITDVITAEVRPPQSAAVSRSQPPRTEHTELIAELTELFTSPDAIRYIVRVWGGPRPDGTWAGWLEYVATSGNAVRRTGQETTQPDRDQVLYWAAGLTPAYFEGAFDRARVNRAA